MTRYCFKLNDLFCEGRPWQVNPILVTKQLFWTRVSVWGNIEYDNWIRFWRPDGCFELEYLFDLIEIVTSELNSGHQNRIWLSYSILPQTDARIQNSYLVTRIGFTCHSLPSQNRPLGLKQYLVTRIEFSCHTLYYTKQMLEFTTDIWWPELSSLVTISIKSNR